MINADGPKPTTPGDGCGHAEARQGSAGAAAFNDPARKGPRIKIGKASVAMDEGGKSTDVEIFTMTLGDERIQLLPLRNWGQLDVHKWTVRGRLPGTPPGLEIALDHVKLAGETITAKDPDAGSKLERLFEEWLEMERETVELARRKAHTKPPTAVVDNRLEVQDQAPHIRVEVDKAGQIHIRCLQGRETAAAIGLNPAGFSTLFSQGLMRKPRSLKVGVMHDWVELDGVLFSFEKGNNDAAALERTLNEKYLPDASLARGKDVLVFANAASSTGFDIQFPVRTAGVVDHHKRALNEDALELLQDPHACGLLHKGIVIKLTRPNLIFKQRTPDGGERCFDKTPENTVTLRDEDGNSKVIDLSQPVNYMRLSTVDLTAVFNHPSINQHSQAAPLPAPPSGTQTPPASPKPFPEVQAPPGPPAASPSSTGAAPLPSELAHLAAVTTQPSELPPQRPTAPATTANLNPQIRVPEESKTPGHPAPPAPPEPSPITAAEPESPSAGQGTVRAAPLPNSWLKDILAEPPIRHDWFACLSYARFADRFGNSHEGKFGLSRCWAVALDEIEDIEDPGFKGMFLTEKGGFGFLNQGYLARFHKGVAMIGTQESAIEGIGVSLEAVGIDAQQRIVFIVADNYRGKFGIPDQALRRELERLKASGAMVMSVKEILESAEALEVVWTVPAQQADPDDPQAIEHTNPEGGQEPVQADGEATGGSRG